MMLGLTREGARLLLAIVEYAIDKGYPVGRFERELLSGLKTQVGGVRTP